MLLQLAGHEVRTAHSGQVALTLADSFQPEIALLDIGMPDVDGYEVATTNTRNGVGPTRAPRRAHGLGTRGR